MDNRPIAVFDSGLGGLTAVRELRRLMPNENIVYFADSGRVPYGRRPAEQLRRMAKQDLDLAASFGAKVILAACGTVSSTAADIISSYPVTAFGVLEPAVKAMAALEGHENLGVIATAASIESGVFQKKIGTLCPGKALSAAACPDFVPLIESGHCSAEDALLQKAVREYLASMKEAGVSALLLGCTHYGLISEAVKGFMGSGLVLVEASVCAAKQIADYIEQKGLAGGSGELCCYTSGSVEEFSSRAGAFLGRGCPFSVEGVEPMEV